MVDRGASPHGRQPATQADHVRKVGERETAWTRARGRGFHWVDCVSEGVWAFEIAGNWSTSALNPGTWYDTVCEAGCRFMAAYVTEKAFKNRRR